MALLDNTHAMYAAAVASPYFNSRLMAMGANGDHNAMNGYMNSRFPTIDDVRISSSAPNSSSSNRSSTSPIPLSRQTIDEETSPTHQTVLNATMSLKLESASNYRHFGHNRSTTFRPFTSNSPDIDPNSNEENRRDNKVKKNFTFLNYKIFQRTYFVFKFIFDVCQLFKG